MPRPWGVNGATDERGRLARSLITLYNQVEAAFPGRQTELDGTIGDAAHQSRDSEHNPDENRVVRALDLDTDPVHGFDARRFAEQLVASKDNRILYLISNRQIVRSYPRSGTVPWQWAPYTLDNPHTEHCHISIVKGALADDQRPWVFDSTAQKLKWNENIKATVFNDTSDAYPPFGTMPDFGYALPGRIEGEMDLKVTNRANGLSAIVHKADIGPWYSGRAGWPEDRWWEAKQRPRAEVDSRTNGAGIDLSPAAARAIGINVVEKNGRIVAGEAQVDVQIVGAEPMAEIDDLRKTVAELGKQVQEIADILGQLVPKPPVTQPPVVAPPTSAPVTPVGKSPFDPTAPINLSTIILSVIAAIAGPKTGGINPLEAGTFSSFLPFILGGSATVGLPQLLFDRFFGPRR